MKKVLNKPKRNQTSGETRTAHPTVTKRQKMQLAAEMEQ